jgi:hypothetical protein
MSITVFTKSLIGPYLQAVHSSLQSHAFFLEDEFQYQLPSTFTSDLPRAVATAQANQGAPGAVQFRGRHIWQTLFWFPLN